MRPSRIFVLDAANAIESMTPADCANGWQIWQITPDRDERRFAELRQIYTLAVCAALR